MTTLPFHNIVSLNGWIDNDSCHTVALGTAVDSSIITKADEGKAVTQDTGAANKFKLAGDGDPVRGFLVTVDQYAQGGPVGTIAFKFIQRMPLLASDAAAIGDIVVGSVGGDSRGGWVKKAPATFSAPADVVTPWIDRNNYVVEKDLVNSPAQWVVVVKQ